MKAIRTLRIQLTEKCNLRCLFCCHEGTVCSFNIIKDSNVVNFIKACYDTLGVKRVKFTGGEPLLHDGSIISIMQKCHDRAIEWSIVTNATDFSKMKEYLNVDGFDITISLPVPFSADSNKYWSITHAEQELVDEYYENVKETISYAKSNNRPIKVNYVLCKNNNDSAAQINEMIELARCSKCIDLRFLETVVNNTNDIDNRMKSYRVTSGEFIETIKTLYSDSKIDNTSRSHVAFELNDGTRFRLVKFFCNDNCHECPDDKTSLWLTPKGSIKKCAFRIQDYSISDWTYRGLCQTLAKIYNI